MSGSTRARGAAVRVSLIVAMDRQRVIGREGALPWHLPDDLKNFKAITLGKPIVMGRRTHESIGRVLPGRRNLVISRRPGYQAPGCEVYATLTAALAACADCAEVMIVGGAELYAAALAIAERLYLTEVETALEGDVWFPAIAPDEWREMSAIRHERDDRHAHAYRYRVLERVSRKVPPRAT